MSTYLREHQIADLQGEKRGLLAMLGDPAAQLQDRGAAHTQVRNIDRQIDKNSPPEVAPAELDDLVREEKQLREELMVGMPSAEEMRKKPEGAVGKHQRWDVRCKEVINPAGDKRMDRWKNLMLRLNRGNTDPDIVNFERFRPKISTLGMHTAEITDSAMRSFATPEFKANYDQVDFGPGSDHDRVQELEAEIAELRKRVEDKKPVELTPRQKSDDKRDMKGRVLIEAHCGRELRPRKGYEKNSLLAHRRTCKICQDQEG